MRLRAPIAKFAGPTAGPRLAAGCLAACLVAGPLPSVHAASATPHPRLSGDAVALSVDSLRAPEGHEGTRSFLFHVRLSAPLAVPESSVDFFTEDGSARAGEDYVAAAGTLALNDTDLVYPVAVEVLGDSIVEANEWFRLRLANPGPGVALLDSIGLAVIVNDERTRFHRTTAGLPTYYSGNLAPAFGDANLDAFPDLPLGRNHGFGNFVNMPGMAAAMTFGNHHGSAWCDYDRDGDPDLVLTPYAEGDSASRLQLLRNLGNEQFEDVAPALGMDISGSAETPVWGDFDGDTWPDLFVPFYAHVAPWRSFLWRNNGDGTFTEIAFDSGVDLSGVPEEFKPEGADAVDWNGDGALDLYCAQHLFQNDGTGHFTDVREAVGLSGGFDECARFVDVDGDGDLDFYLRTWNGPELFRNEGGSFVDVTAASGLGPRQLTWGDSWADVDNDGDLDLLMLNRDSPAELFLNDGNGHFESDSSFTSLGLEPDLSSWADVDLDGDLDAGFGASDRSILVNHLTELANASKSTLRVWVLDEDSLRVCPGAIARLTELGGGPGAIQTRVVDGGSGYLTQSEYPLHFGGIGDRIYSLEVRYPGTDSSATVVDGNDDPLLAGFNPVELGMGYLFVFRDGRVSWRPPGPRNPLAVPVAVRPREELGAPRPTPARDHVAFAVSAGPEPAEVEIFDLSGRRQVTVSAKSRADGPGGLEWDLRDASGRAVPNGVYLARLKRGGEPAGTRRVIVLR